MPAVQKIDAQVIFKGSLSASEVAASLLQALEAVPSLVPDRWGADVGIRDPYVREQVFDALVDQNVAEVHLHRVAPVKYAATVHGDDVLSTLTLSTRGQLDGRLAADVVAAPDANLTRKAEASTIAARSNGKLDGAASESVATGRATASVVISRASLELVSVV